MDNENEGKTMIGKWTFEKELDVVLKRDKLFTVRFWFEISSLFFLFWFKNLNTFFHDVNTSTCICTCPIKFLGLILTSQSADLVWLGYKSLCTSYYILYNQQLAMIGKQCTFLHSNHISTSSFIICGSLSRVIYNFHNDANHTLSVGWGRVSQVSLAHPAAWLSSA